MGYYGQTRGANSPQSFWSYNWSVDDSHLSQTRAEIGTVLAVRTVQVELQMNCGIAKHTLVGVVEWIGLEVETKVEINGEGALAIQGEDVVFAQGLA